MDSCDNPGWWVKIDLVGTSLEHASFVRVAHGVNEVGFATESDWIDCKVTEAIFDGAGDAGKLETIFTIFLDWKDRCEQQGGGYSPPAARSSKPTP